MTGEFICAECSGKRAERTEYIVRDALLPLVKHPPSIVDEMVGNKNGGCDSFTSRRPDLAWISEDKRRIVEVEIDEDGGHPDRETSCEIGKICDQADAFNKLAGLVANYYVIRFNPDRCDGTPLKERIKVVAHRINELLFATPFEDKMLLPQVDYYYYHESCYFQIEAAKEASTAINVGRVYPNPSPETMDEEEM